MTETAEAGWRAVAALYHRYFTGLILMVASRRGARDIGELMFRVFRHQHEERFLPGLEKLGLSGLPDPVACAGYHYLSNSVGGVAVEFMRESDRKAWVRFIPPRWVYEGAAICGVPSEASRGMLRGWYAQNGVSLGNPRLGFVCTAQTMDGQSGLSGYFLEHDRDLAPDERLRFSPGEEPPPFDPAAAPKLGDSWPASRLAKANRNYAMEYIRTTLPRMTELFGPAEAAALGNLAGRLIGMQHYAETRRLLALGEEGGAAGFAAWLCAMGEAQGDRCESHVDGGAVLVRQTGWRLMQGLPPLSPAVVDAWNGLWQGALAVHDRFLVLDLLERPDYGDASFVWRIRRKGAQG